MYPIPELVRDVFLTRSLKEMPEWVKQRWINGAKLLYCTNVRGFPLVDKDKIESIFLVHCCTYKGKCPNKKQAEKRGDGLCWGCWYKFHVIVTTFCINNLTKAKTEIAPSFERWGIYVPKENKMKNEIIFELEKILPPVFAERVVPELIPGLVDYRTLKNYRCQGRGPKYFKVGRRILYRRSDFLAWLESRIEHNEEDNND